jgi:hypothetical protein
MPDAYEQLDRWSARVCSETSTADNIEKDDAVVYNLVSPECLATSATYNVPPSVCKRVT